MYFEISFPVSLKKPLSMSYLSLCSDIRTVFAVSKTPAISATYNTLMTPMNALCASSCYPCLLSE